MDKLDKDLSIIFFLMRFVALWPYDYNRHLPVWIQRYRVSLLLNVLYYLFWQFICSHIAVFHVIRVLNSLDNFDNLFLVMVNTIIYCLMLLINANFRLYYHKNLVLIECLKHHFRQRSAAGLSFVKSESSRRYFSRLFKIWITTCVLGTMHWSLFPILQREKVLPLQCWYPFDVHRSPMYELAYLGQVLGQLQVSLVYGMTGALLMMYIFIVCGQFDILCCSLKNVYYTALINTKGNRFILSVSQVVQEKTLRETNELYIKEVFLEELSKAPKMPTKKLAPVPEKHQYLDYLQDKLATAFDECIDHHVILLKFCRLLEDSFHPFILLKLVQMMSLLCLLSYMATVDNLSFMKLMNIGEYFVLTMTELFLFCYLGETLKNQSLKVSDALLKSTWYKCGAHFRRRAIMLLMASQKPLSLTALKLYPLDFAIYRSVLTTAFSYYTILKKLQSGRRHAS